MTQQRIEPPIAAAYYGTKHKLMAVLLAFITIAFVGGMIATEGLANSQSIFAAALITVILVGPIVALLLEFWFVRIDVTHDSLLCQSPWRRDRVIPLSDVVIVDFSTWAQWFRIHTKSNGTVRLHGYLLGLYDVLGAIESAGHSFPRVRHVR